MSKETVAGLVLLTTFARESVAQSTPTVSQLDQERQRIELERRQMFGPNNLVSKAKKSAMLNSAGIDRGVHRAGCECKQMSDPNNPTTKNVTNVFPNVSASEHTGIGIEALAKQYEQKAQAREMDDLAIFASFTISTESPKRIVSRVNRVGVSVVLRGFKNSSLKDAALATKEPGERGGNILVSPNAFAKYKARAVPTMVLAKTVTTNQVDNKDCVLPGNFAAVAGNVSLDYTLNEIVHRVLQFEAVASCYLRQIRGNQ